MRRAVLVALLLVAGCATPSPGPVAPTTPLDTTADDPIPLVPSGPLLNQVMDGQIVPVNEIGGLAVLDEGLHLNWTPLEFMEPSFMQLLLLRATQNVSYTFAIQEYISLATNRDSVTTTHETVCVAAVVGPGGVADPVPVRGDDMIHYALGNPVNATGILPDYDLSWGSLYGASAPSAPGTQQGSVGASGTRTGTLAAGEWMLWGGGLWGFDQRNVDVDSILFFDLRTDAPMQAYKLPSAPLVCGMGFSSLENETLHTGAPLSYHKDGALDVEMRYGSAFVWQDICWPGDGPAPLNAATIRVDDEERPLTQVTLNMTIGSFSTRPARMAVDEWKGYPFWLLLGLAMDPEDLTPRELLGCLK